MPYVPLLIARMGEACHRSLDARYRLPQGLGPPRHRPEQGRRTPCQLDRFGTPVRGLYRDSILGESRFSLWAERPMLTAQKAVIATGAQQPHPMRPVPGSSEAEYRASLVKLQGEFQKAKSVVIVGGGASGLEVAGVSVWVQVAFSMLTLTNRTSGNATQTPRLLLSTRSPPLSTPLPSSPILTLATSLTLPHLLL